MQLDYGMVDGYWLETHSRLDFSLRLFGIGVRHASIDLTYQITQVQ